MVITQILLDLTIFIFAKFDSFKLMSTINLCTLALIGTQSKSSKNKASTSHATNEEDEILTDENVANVTVELGYDPGTGKIDASDEWWERKLKECSKAKLFRKKGLPNAASMEIMFEGTIATKKHAWTPRSQIPKESTKDSRDSSDSKEFVNPQCQSPMDVDPMDVECPLLSRAGPKVNKGKGLASNV
ncbi:hypothetical protein SO802_012674 [Lithocarpus litseifolius]|uniref:Uncharacterized protein n=1 Tax=Lithocarpus litseifolius TaxID=425828 RepID=A0AAW2D5Y6_9ROSI